MPSFGALSVDSGQIVEPDYEEHGRGFGQSDDENILVSLPVGEACDREQGDDSAVVRQSIHAAAGH